MDLHLNGKIALVTGASRGSAARPRWRSGGRALSSISGKLGEGSDHAYGAMKAALIAAGKTLAVALAKDGIRVNVVAPGGMDEPGSEWKRLRATEPARVAAIEKSIPMGRLGNPAEVADCIAFLVSEQANRIVGH